MANDGDMIRVDVEKLALAVKLVNTAALNGQGIFKGGRDVWKRRFLPQWMLPSEMEYDHPVDEVKKPLEAARFLFSEDYIERRGVSRFYAKGIRRVWADSKMKWFFDPREVIKRDLGDIEAILKNEIKFNLKKEGGLTPAEGYRANAQRLTRTYDGDPRNVVDGLNAEQARARLKEFEFFGDGIANLYIIYLLDRGLVSLVDPENAILKVDTHKSRLPVKIGAVTLTGEETKVHHAWLERNLMTIYQQICKRDNHSPILTNDSLWVNGSEVCAKSSYRVCLRDCPLASSGLCKANSPLVKGSYYVESQSPEVFSLSNDEKTTSKSRKRGILPVRKEIMHIYRNRFR